jgi:3-methyladenine DNA glycosylase AlkD
MDLGTAMRRLEAAGTEQNRKVYPRHGITSPMFGVSYADLGKLQKEIKVDDGLARELWATGNHDARILATKVADAATMSARDADAWLRDVDDYVLMEALGRLVVRSPVAASRARAWRDRRGEWPASAGWVVTASLAVAGDIDRSEALALVSQIEREIHTRPNRVRHEMNGALIALGMMDAEVRDRAVRAAERIGTVVVDHGRTGCVTPDAAAYIRKAEARATLSAARR